MRQASKQCCKSGVAATSCGQHSEAKEALSRTLRASAGRGRLSARRGALRSCKLLAYLYTTTTTNSHWKSKSISTPFRKSSEVVETRDICIAPGSGRSCAPWPYYLCQHSLRVSTV